MTVKILVAETSKSDSSLSWSCVVLLICLQVVAVDQATDGLRATAQLNITVLDYNDNAPQFPPIADPLQIPEGNYTEENPGDIVTIVPTDADLGPNGEVTLSLSSPHPLFRFREVRRGEDCANIFNLYCVGAPALSHVMCCRMGHCLLLELWIGRAGKLMSCWWRPQTTAPHRERWEQSPLSPFSSQILLKAITSLVSLPQNKI